MIKCTICNDTGKRAGSDYLDCGHCGAAEERAAMIVFAADHRDPLWPVHQRARQIEREEHAEAAKLYKAQIDDLEQQNVALTNECRGMQAEKEAQAARIAELERGVRVLPMTEERLEELADEFSNGDRGDFDYAGFAQAVLAAALSAPAVEQQPFKIESIDMPEFRKLADAYHCINEQDQVEPIYDAMVSFIDAEIERQVKAASTAPSAPAVEQASHQRDMLAKGIAAAALKAGVWNGETDLTGPHLLMLCDGLAEAAAPQAADTDKVREALSNLRARVYEMKEAAYTFGDNSKEVAGIALDGVLDEIDAELSSMAAQAPVREVPEGWKLIPLKPTYEMRCAFQFARKVTPYKVEASWNDPTAPVVAHYESDSFDVRWDAMLAAAPLPAAPVQQEGGL